MKLLPYEKELAKIIGVSEDVYQQWKAITLWRSIQRPADPGPTCGLLVPALTNLAISVGLTLLSSLLFPGSPASRSPRVTVRRTGGGGRTSDQRLSPRYGFDSLQDVAEVGQLIPVITANRENGLGGVRVSMPLVWSQVLAHGGSLMFRGIFLAGAADMGPDAWDPRGWAFGNNVIAARVQSAPVINNGSSCSIYFAPAGGRITSDQLIAGKQAVNDPGNFQDPGQDVFAVNIGDGEYRTAFCMSEVPSTNTRFGLYGWAPNAMMYRSAVLIQPTVTARIDSNDKIQTDDDAAALVELWKGKWFWSTHSGLRGYKAAGSTTWTTPASGDHSIVELPVSVGDELRYELQRTTDAETIIRFDKDNCRITDNDASADEQMRGIASAVAGIQNSADSSLVTNELFRIGSCWAILQQRIPQYPSESIFISDSEQEPTSGGNNMYYIFLVVTAGSVQFVGPKILDPIENSAQIKPPEYNPNNNLALLLSGTEGRYRVCSDAAQVFRMAVASFGAVREFKVCEMIIKSKVGIKINGMTGFTSIDTIERINEKAGQNQVGKTANGRLTTSRYDSSGSAITASARRYSAFLFRYSADRGATWVVFPEVFAVSGVSGEDVYSYLRLNFPTSRRWERSFVPISSWEIRKNQPSRIIILDSGSNQELSVTAGGVTVSTTGYEINPNDPARRRLAILEPQVDIGLGWSDQSLTSMIDGYARFAEAFPYSNLQSTVGTAPEHEVTHINYFGDLDQTPSYQGIAPVGINVLASPQLSNLQAFSGFCNKGRKMPRLLHNNTKGATHLFPDWLRELLTSADVGVMPRVPAVQIDEASFYQAALWCQERKYYYDAVDGEPLNLLSWAADVAQAHLLKLVELGGVYHLKKAIEFENKLKIEAQFTNGNVAEGSLRLKTIGYLERQPFIVQVKWREESTGIEAPLFPRERVAMVRAVGTGADAPVRTLDLSKWCTNYKQAIDAACYLILFVTLHDHEISFVTSPDVLAANIRSGGFFQMSIEVINYNTVRQGFIKDDGTIVTARPDILPTGNGSYPALVWNASLNVSPEERPVVITDGRAEPSGYFFSLASGVTKSRTYEIKKVNIDPEGVIAIDAFHHPTDNNGYSLLGVNWTTYQTDANWIIEL